MPYLVYFDSNEVVKLIKPVNRIINLGDKDKLKIVCDTEFTFSDLLIVDSIQFYLPLISPNECLVFFRDELTNDFNPVESSLYWYGNDIKSMNEDEIDDLYKFQELFDELIEDCHTGQQIKNEFNKALEQGLFTDLFKAYNLKSEQLTYNKNKHTGEYETSINIDTLLIEYEGFFNDVDLFKTFGKNSQETLLNARLESRRVIKTNSIKSDIKLGNAYWINGKLYEICFNLRDAMNRFPVLSGRGLDNQCKVYQATTTKINIETNEIAAKLGLKDKLEIKTKMTLLRELDPYLFALYGGTDVLATHNLSVKHQELLDGIRNDFNLNSVEVKDTTGSNVASFIQDLYQAHFNPNNDEEIAKLIIGRKRLGNADSVQDISLNYYGIQSLRTVGGLLYSRCQRYPYIKGLLGDLDMSSCYATRLCSLTVYLGQPIVSCFKGKNKPTLKEALETIKNVNSPRDGWIVRVSGQLNKAINTLILSDLDFTPKAIKFKKIWDVNPNRLSINHFNAYKIGKQEAQSTLLTKEIKFGLINGDLLDCINLLPDEWIDEYLSLNVDAMVFIPDELICNSVNELISKFDDYPDSDECPTWDKKTGLTGLLRTYSQSNLCLAFPIGQYYEKLKAKRKDYKKLGNPIQEVYKLFLNSGYGALACRYLPVNNLLAANQITASPRATCWLMMNAINAFQGITDGCTFNWESVPIGLKFRELLETNPNYLIDYQTNIKSNLTINNDNAQEWINDNFKQHLYNFYEIDSNHIPGNRYDYELKDEKFNEVKTIIYTDFINTGSGNYSKGFNGESVLINGTEYDFTDEFKKVKARSFKGDNKELLHWYIQSLCKQYLEPSIYFENQIIKFGDAKELATRLLNKHDEIAYPCGFSKTNYKIMKLITRSQFLFKTEKQLRNFETNQKKLDEISKFILKKSFWQSLPDNLDKLTQYGINELLLDWESYYNFAKEKPIGLGFELLALNNSHKGSIASVRSFIADKIDENKKDFNSTLNIDKYINLANQFKWLFTSIIILKSHSDYKLEQQLVNSINEPTVFTVNRESVVTLSELLGIQESE